MSDLPASSPRGSLSSAPNDAAALAFQQIAALQAQVAQLTNAAVRAPRAELPKIRAPSAFAGAMGTAVDEWLAEIVQQHEFYGSTKFPDAPSLIRFAAAHFTGIALTWWNALADRGTIQTWEVFVNRLHDRFRPVQAAMFARQRLDKLRMREGHKVNAYASVFQTTMTPITNMHDADQVHHFVNGLLPRIAEKVWERHPTTLGQAIDIAVTVEAMLEFGRSASGGMSHRMQSGGFGRSTHAPSSHGSVPMEISALEEDLLSESLSSTVVSNPPGDVHSALLAAMAELSSSFDQRLNALAQSRFGGGAPRGDRVGGLKAGEISKLMAEGKCFRCKQKGHMKNECPQGASGGTTGANSRSSSSSSSSKSKNA
jgi:hypothetical protein